MENETPDLATLDAGSRFNIDRTEFQTDGSQKAFVTILPGSDATLDLILRQARTIHTQGTRKLTSVKGVTVETRDSAVYDLVTDAMVRSSKYPDSKIPISHMEFKDGVLTIEPVKPTVNPNASKNGKVSSLQFTFKPARDFLKDEHH